MSAVSAVPAAVRSPRSAAARRAVLTLLLLGGFLALAFVFGGSAQAATGLDSTKGTSGGGSTDLLKPEESPGGSISEDEAADHHQAAQEAAGEAASHVLDPVAEGAEDAERITRPVGEAVGGVSDAAGLGGLTERLGLQLGDGRGDGAPESDGGDNPGRDDGGSSAGGTGGASTVADRQPVQRTSDGPAAGSAPSAVRHAEAHDGIPREGDGLPGPNPFQQAPVTPSAGSSQFASDGNGPRGGGAKQLAGYLTDVELLGLPQPGALSAAADAPTRDRASEVLEFPG